MDGMMTWDDQAGIVPVDEKPIEKLKKRSEKHGDLVRFNDTDADRIRVEETYNWRDDVMEITRRIVHETDEARLSNIANHFEVDLSEIRAFLEMKQQQQQRKPITNADRIRVMTDEELAEWLAKHNERSAVCPNFGAHDCQASCRQCWLDWLKEEAGK